MSPGMWFPERFSSSPLRHPDYFAEIGASQVPFFEIPFTFPDLQPLRDTRSALFWPLARSAPRGLVHTENPPPAGQLPSAN